MSSDNENSPVETNSEGKENAKIYEAEKIVAQY